MVISTLDVGCGDKEDFHYFNCTEEIVHVDVADSRFSDVRCDGQFLPFRSKCFDRVFSRLVIEYTDNPALFLRELIRTSKHEVTVVTPHRFSRIMRAAHAKHQLTKSWFHRTLKFFIHNITFEFGLFRLDTEIPVPFSVPKFIIVRIKVDG